MPPEPEPIGLCLFPLSSPLAVIGGKGFHSPPQRRQRAAPTQEHCGECARTRPAERAAATAAAVFGRLAPLGFAPPAAAAQAAARLGQKFRAGGARVPIRENDGGGFLGGMWTVSEVSGGRRAR